MYGIISLPLGKQYKLATQSYHYWLYQLDTTYTIVTGYFCKSTYLLALDCWHSY